MNNVTGQEWRQEFGIDESTDLFFSTKTDLHRATSDTSLMHVARRAFDILNLNGVLGTDSAPLVYFKLVTHIDNVEIAKLHRTFWNHGGAPLLTIIGPSEVHIYSGFVRPNASVHHSHRIPAFVEMLERSSSELKAFLPAVQSGAFFRKHARSFDVSQRVDRDLLDNLQATRNKLLALPRAGLDTNTDAFDALLCRLVFTCYLFDRDVIGDCYKQLLGLPNAEHLSDVLGLMPRTEAKNQLYKLFKRLGSDFNGDLFSDDLESEARLLSTAHIDCLYDFFRATDAVSGQLWFWPYDFSVIPIETISAIYERFLEASARRTGAFYTPRFLAELVLDIALSADSSLLNRRYLDPACGSGIFLVGLFNRMAEEWKQTYPEASNDCRARELRKVLCENLCGIDFNSTACRIATFSLCLAYLDQLSPRDIEALRLSGHGLPKLLNRAQQGSDSGVEGSIWCGDFFSEERYPRDVDVVVGNPPWGSIAESDSPVAVWCSRMRGDFSVPDKQVSTAFMWKAANHVRDSGRVCFVLPHSTLFNRRNKALQFQQALFTRHTIEHVVNLADYQRFLFEEASHPAIVISYRRSPPGDRNHRIQYVTPKVDWLSTLGEVIAVMPEDQSTLTREEVLLDLKGRDAPQIWKQWFWATRRDRLLIERLSLYPRLRDRVRQVREIAPGKPWVVGVGVQDLGERDDPSEAETITLPSRLFIDARSRNIDLFVVPSDCVELHDAKYTVRKGSNKAIIPFRAPHVLVKEGFAGAAYADFDVSFRFSLRGINGPAEDRDQLIFLAAYLGTALARFFLFHTSSSWGISRQRVGVDELLRLPFPLPESLSDPQHARKIIEDVARIYTETVAAADDPFIDRGALVKESRVSIEALVSEYFDILSFERILIDDTVRVTIPSTRPTRSRRVVPTVKPSTREQLNLYAERLSVTLNAWAKEGVDFHGHATASTNLGIGVAVLEKHVSERKDYAFPYDINDLLGTLDRLRDASSQPLNTFELMRGIKVFERDRLFIVKPISQRFWTETAALNDADEIAGSILMQRSRTIA